MKTKRANNAISEIIGTMLMLGISVSLFSVVYISVLTVPYSPPTPSANIIYQIEGGNIILSHYGGKALNLDTEIVMKVDDLPVDPISVGDYLYNDTMFMINSTHLNATIDSRINIKPTSEGKKMLLETQFK